jgi:D,D-heptose 1,7-bisphosphate phosphatase
MQKNKAAFLDRDGTINVDNGYTYKIEDLEFLPGAVEGLKELQKKGYLLIIITNQSGIGRGYYTEKDYKNFMKEFYKRLEEKGVKITADYYCPHRPEDKCRCRKPMTELVEKAIKDYDIDSSKSIFIGDKKIDMETGKRCGVGQIREELCLIKK